MKNQRIMFTMGPVHTRDHGPLCSVTDTEPTVRRWKGKGLIYMPWEGGSNRGSTHPVEHLEAHR